jgi:methylamine dehydrogenase accessory protein MauD
MNELVITAIGLLWIVVIALGIAGFALSRQIGVLLERVAPAGALLSGKGLASGEPAPELALTALDGSSVRVGGKRSDARSTLVFFLSPTCPMCKAALAAVRSIASRENAWLDVVLASDGDDEDHADYVRRNRVSNLPYVVSEELGLGFRVGQLPHAALVDENGLIVAAGLTNTREHVESLLEAKHHGVSSLQEFMKKNASAAGER